MLKDLKFAAILVGIGICLAVPAAAQPAVTLTGCLDEQAGPQYVLREPHQLRLIALLEPAGFPVQSFAKYLGHRVSVTGSRTSAAETPLVKVRKIRSLANTCGKPAQHAAGSETTALSAPTNVSGCLDEEPGPRYVLRGDRELKLLMELEPDGFPVQNFARYLGHRVDLRGRTYSRNDRTVMKVQTIKSLADQCIPR